MAPACIVVFLLAKQQLTWMPFDRDRCVAIEEAVRLGKRVSLTTMDGKRHRIFDALCMTKEEAGKRFGFMRGMEV